MKECDAPESNSTTAEVSLMKNVPMTTSGAFLSFFHRDVIDLPVNIDLSSSNRNRISLTERHRGGHGCLWRAVVLTGALVGKVTFLATSVARPFTQQWVLSSLSPLNTLIPSSRSLGAVRA
jgi:hypothetical protein